MIKGINTHEWFFTKQRNMARDRKIAAKIRKQKQRQQSDHNRRDKRERAREYMEESRKRKKQADQKKEEENNVNECMEFLQESQFLSQDEKSSVIEDFERQMQDVHHQHCKICHRTGLNLVMATNEQDVCSSCKTQGVSTASLFKEELLPFWTDDNGNIQCHVPNELSCLREGEKLLIQRVSPYVPLVHIKNGTLGSKGHVCSFPQNVQEVCTSLPRIPSSVEFVKMVRKFKNDDGDFGIKAFTVRRKEVLVALRWLKKYNVDYRSEVTIDETNLKWMDGQEEAELPFMDMSNEEDEEEEVRGQENLGPAHKQCLPTHLSEMAETEDALKTCGVQVHDSTPFMSESDEKVRDGLSS
jgi:hypothetical protein